MSIIRPSKGTITARVWGIADQLSSELGQRAERRDVVRHAVASDINSGTANTSYGHWKRFSYPELNRKLSGPGLNKKPGVPTQRSQVPWSQAGIAPLNWLRLLKNEFRYGVDWRSDGENGLIPDRPAPVENGVYVFVWEEEITYIGVTTRTLKARMTDYQRGHKSQKTSARLHSLILEKIMSRQTVRVLFAVPGQTEWNGLPVERAPGLEMGLISLIKPRWNMRGNQ
ncbi:MAG: hypothetical protein V3U96_03215 [Paracoccaceae bacterium]